MVEPGPKGNSPQSVKRQALLEALKSNILAIWVLGALVALLATILWVMNRKFSLEVLLFLDLTALALAAFDYFVFYKRKKRLRFALNMQSLVVLLLMTIAIHFSGGITSPLLWLYILSIVVEGMSRGGHRSFAVATAANALLIALVWLEFSGQLQATGLSVEAGMVRDAAYVSRHLVSVVLFNYLVAFAVYVWAGMLFKQQAELRALDQAKDLFISITSHELRTPLTPMKAQLQLLQSGFLGEVSPRQKESLDMVLRNAGRLEKLIGDVMDVSRISAGKLNLIPVKADLREVISKVIEIEQPIASVKDIKIRLEAEPCPEFLFDPDRITQVLTNLVDNAIKYSDKDGKIAVSLRCAGKEAVVGVSDAGRGISAEEQGKLFTPFFRVDPASADVRKGTGLGLAICKGIIEAHQGRLWCESAKGKGAAFYFSLPLKDGA